VTSTFDRPPTAEELRAAFSRRHTDDDPPPAREDSFTKQFPTESLFVPTIEEPELEENLHAEDRSRTTGDYYYDPEDAWAVLGLTPGSPWKEIAAAHRRLAMRHHPDRLLDASPKERAASEETMREVNVAYNVLRRLTGN
jgi:DnaJ-domain-containing protein 1